MTMTRLTFLPRPSSTGSTATLLVAILLTVTSAAPTQATQQITGRVTASDGTTPLANARILLGLRIIGRTDAGGQFDVTVPKGKTLLRIEKAGYLTGVLDEGGTNKTVRMVKGGTLILRVIDAAGAPVGLRSIRLAGPFGLARRITDDNGVDRLTGLPAGRYVADLEAYAGPAAAKEDDRAEQGRRDLEARNDTLERRNGGSQLHEGEELTLTLVDAWRPSTSSRRDSRSGSIRGRVTAPDGRPVANARLRLVAALESQAASSATDGTFVFDGVPPARYKLYADAPGFILREAGDQDADGIGQSITLAAGQQRTDVNVQLYRGGVVTGTVRDEHGEPYEMMNVQLFAVKSGTQDVVTTRVATVASTNERGEYRLSGVAPGRYFLVARPRVGRSEGPVYFPDKQQFADATPIDIVEGMTRSGADMRIDAGHGSRVSGVVTDSKGALVTTGSVQLHGTDRTTSAVIERQAQIGPDGRFEFHSVLPGGYALTVGSPIPFDSLTINGILSGPLKLQFAAERESGGLDIVATADRGVTASIQTSPRAMITGHAYLEDPNPSVSPAGFELSAGRDDAKAPLRDDWTFELRDISQTSRLTLTRAPAGWWLKSVTVKGVNAADVPVEFGLAAHSRHGVTAVLSHTAASVNGRVEDERGAAVPNAPVTVFSVDRTRWDDRSLHRQALRTDGNGNYSVNVPPGEYWVVAAEPREMGSRSLAGLTKSASRVTAGPSAVVTQNLRLVR
jgi:protocatechuate 3,4-dioxygenase beta subunit